MLPENYRPISLTSVACKIFEKLLKNKILKHINDNNLLSTNQHGFLRNKSCVTNLIETFEIILSSIASHQSIDVIYLAFAKAFDSVPHSRLMLKLRSFGVN